MTFGRGKRLRQAGGFVVIQVDDLQNLFLCFRCVFFRISIVDDIGNSGNGNAGFFCYIPNGHFFHVNSIAQIGRCRQLKSGYVKQLTGEK